MEDGAVPVHISNFDEMVFRTEETEPEHFAFATLTILPGISGGNTGNTGGASGLQELLSQDPLRKNASILPIDAAIVLCDSTQQAGSPSNQVTGLPSPAGAYVPMGTSVSLSGTGAAWVACQVATRVSVIINRRAK